MSRTTSMRLAVLLLGVGLIAVLPASAAAKKPKARAKTELAVVPFLLPANNPDEAQATVGCPSGTTLLSGGGLSNTPVPAGPPELDTEIYISGPAGPDTWLFRLDNDSNVALQPTAQAICIKDRLKIKGAVGAGKSTAVAAAKKPKAVSRVTQVNTPFTLPPSTAATNNGHAQLDVVCPEGTKVAGGGASFGVTGDIQLQESGPQGNGWHVRYDNDEPLAQTGIASALCLKSKLKVKGLGGAGKSTATAAKSPKARSKFEQVDQVVSLPPIATNNGRARFTVTCPEGTTIAGGGANVSDGVAFADNDFQLEESGAAGNAWQVTIDNDEAVAQSATISALCLKNKLKVK